MANQAKDYKNCIVGCESLVGVLCDMVLCPSFLRYRLNLFGYGYDYDYYILALFVPVPSALNYIFFHRLGIFEFIAGGRIEGIAEWGWLELCGTIALCGFVYQTCSGVRYAY
jgi:hypothetical protein